MPRLRRFARTLTGDSTAADDLVQDTLERALSRMNQTRSADKLRSWLFAIMINIFRDGLRSRRRQPDSTGLHSEIDANIAQQPRQVDIVGAIQVLEALQKLPADRREALALVAVEGYGYREAAELLKIPVGTLMSRLARGRKQLRAVLAETPANDSVQLRSLK